VGRQDLLEANRFTGGSPGFVSPEKVYKKSPYIQMD
jgi:hypothetical protein